MSFVARLLSGASLAVALGTGMPLPAVADVVFQSTPITNNASHYIDQRSAGSTAVGRLTVSSPQTITGIGVLNFIPMAEYIKFFIGNAATGAMLYLSIPQLFAADAGTSGDVGSMTYKVSAPLSFTFEPGITYAVGSIADGETWTFIDGRQANISGAFTSYIGNVNVSGYAAPTLTTGLRCCNVGFEVLADQVLPEPATFGLLVVGLAGLGAARRGGRPDRGHRRRAGAGGESVAPRVLG